MKKSILNFLFFFFYFVKVEWNFSWKRMLPFSFSSVYVMDGHPWLAQAMISCLTVPPRTSPFSPEGSLKWRGKAVVQTAFLGNGIRPALAAKGGCIEKRSDENDLDVIHWRFPKFSPALSLLGAFEYFPQTSSGLSCHAALLRDEPGSGGVWRLSQKSSDWYFSLVSSYESSRNYEAGKFS